MSISQPIVYCMLFESTNVVPLAPGHVKVGADEALGTLVEDCVTKTEEDVEVVGATDDVGVEDMEDANGVEDVEAMELIEGDEYVENAEDVEVNEDADSTKDGEVVEDVVDIEELDVELIPDVVEALDKGKEVAVLEDVGAVLDDTMTVLGDEGAVLDNTVSVEDAMVDTTGAEPAVMLVLDAERCVDDVDEEAVS